jgi:hypothetical protein
MLALDRAVITTLPALIPVTRPLALTDAIAGLLENQVTAVETPDDALTVAASDSVLPTSTTPACGDTEIETLGGARSVTASVRLSRRADP